MEAQDGISVRPMRLKVLYTFDDESKTNCLARWPHLVEVQTAFLDEQTQIGVIELRTCIQAIVAASPELIAKMGQDFTVYAYDYSEYETPLVGQGMLSWVLASSSPTPNAPAHQSKTIVTGRVSKNILGLFSKGAQEMLEVKLRLVPVPTIMQSEYLESMQRYRELSNIIPEGFDAQAWTSFVQQNSNLFTNNQRPPPTERSNSSVDHSGIERFHQLLSEGSTPREIPSMNHESPDQSPFPPPSRSTSPNGARLNPQQQQQLPPEQHKRRESEVSVRPSSRASAREPELQRSMIPAIRRGSFQSGYGSGDESVDQPPRKRARIFRADVTGKDDMNIERQPGSLRVAASTAASVRIHRPTPIHLASSSSATGSLEEPIRPPTPISRTAGDFRRNRPAPSLLRESSTQSNTLYMSPYPTGDEPPPTQPPATSPDDNHYQGIFESQFTMPSSPPVIDGRFPTLSSPVLPPLPMPPDSGFMSATLDDLIDEDGCIRTNLDDDSGTPPNECGEKHDADYQPNESAVQETSPVNAPSALAHQADNFLASEGVFDNITKETAPPSLPPQRASTTSRPSSRASIRMAPKLAPAPLSQSEMEQLIHSVSVPASDPVLPPPHGYLQHANSWSGSMSDFPIIGTPAPQPVEDGKSRSGAGARRVRQVQARLDQCIKEGQAPPYCQNCGAIETPTWRRAWSKKIDGTEEDANACLQDPFNLFWEVVEKDDDGKVAKFKVFKKTLVDTDKDFLQILLCNPCGLWFQKFKSMRPENKWNKLPPKNKRKRSARNRNGPLSGGSGAATRSRSKALANLPAGSSPAQTDVSTPAGDDGSAIGVDQENDNEDGFRASSAKRLRASSAEPRRTTDTAQSRWHEHDAMEALRRAIQSSPARNFDTRALQLNEESLTPKPVRRSLFPTAQEGPLKALGESMINSPRRSPRNASKGSENAVADKENRPAATHDNVDDLFESPTFNFGMPTTPTPKRRTPRGGTTLERRLSLPFCSPTANRGKGPASSVSPSKQEKNKERNPTLETTTSPNGSIRSKNGFPVMDNIVLDIFDPWESIPPQNDLYMPFEDWTPPPDLDAQDFSIERETAWDVDQSATSPRGETGSRQVPGAHTMTADDEAMINAILCDPEVHKTAMRESEMGTLFGRDSTNFISDLMNAEHTLKEPVHTSNGSNPNEGEAQIAASSA